MKNKKGRLSDTTLIVILVVLWIIWGIYSSFKGEVNWTLFIVQAVISIIAVYTLFKIRAKYFNKK